MSSDAASTAHTSLAPPTNFEKRLSEAIDIAWGRGSGTVWGNVQSVLGAGIGYPTASVGAISVTTQGVVNNRPLSAGLITRPREFLLVVVGAEVGLARQAQAIRTLIPLTLHLTTIGLVEQVNELWRVRRIIEVQGVGNGDQIKRYFPLVRAVEEVRREPPGDASSEGGLFEQEQLIDDHHEAANGVELEDPSSAALVLPGPIPGLVARLLATVEANKLVFPDAERLARSCIFALLRGHLVLHGPPGTAKTTLARLLVELFDCSESLRTATSDWTTYDVVGGFRPGSGADGKETLVPHFGCVTEAVLDCRQSVEDHLAGNSTKQANWLILDELNRADIDRAIGPLYTALGGVTNEIPLWFVEDELAQTLIVPTRFRIVATMNDVDTAFVNELSQGLARRFTFVFVGVPNAVQADAESAALEASAVAWLGRQFRSVLGADPAAAAHALTTRDDYREARRHLDELALWIRHGRPGAGVEPDGDGDAQFDGAHDDEFGDDEGLPTGKEADARGPRWPLGTAQLLDVHRQLLLAAAAGTDLGAALDDAVSQSIVPQFAHAPRSTVLLLTRRFDDEGLPVTSAALHRILDPLST